jgi:protein-S-isoprenylcysteine O-methyltransferase Ste14
MFAQANPLAMIMVVAAWIGTQLGLVLHYRVLARQNAKAPAQRDPVSILFFVIQSASIFFAFSGPIIIETDRTSRQAQIEVGVVAGLVLAAMIIFISAIRTLGANFALVAQVRNDGQLVTSGPFALVRNPIYLAYLILLIATCLAYGHVRNLVYAVPVYLLGAALRILREERVLRAHFGAAYDDYARRIKRLIPFIW